MRKIAIPRTIAAVESYTLLNGKKQLNLIELNKLII